MPVEASSKIWFNLYSDFDAVFAFSLLPSLWLEMILFLYGRGSEYAAPKYTALA